MSEDTLCKPERRLVDLKIEADLDMPSWYWDGNLEKRAKQMERLAAEFIDHCKNHRDLDHIDLRVERVYEDVCSACGREWEPCIDNDGGYCAHCCVDVQA